MICTKLAHPRKCFAVDEVWKGKLNDKFNSWWTKLNKNNHKYSGIDQILLVAFSRYLKLEPDAWGATYKWNNLKQCMLKMLVISTANRLRADISNWEESRRYLKIMLWLLLKRGSQENDEKAWMKELQVLLAALWRVTEKRDTLSGILKIDRDLDFPVYKFKIETEIHRALRNS